MRNAAENKGKPPDLEAARDLGRKVSVLYRLEADTHPFSEAVGFLQRIDQKPDGQVYVLARKDGSTVEIRQRDVLRMKFI